MFREIPFQPDDIVKSCSKLESGMFLGCDGLRACSRGALFPPIFCTREEILQGKASKALIVQRRIQLLRMLNDDHNDMACKRCLMVERKRYGDIVFSKLNHLDLQHYTECNLRCKYCTYTRNDTHVPPQYDALTVLHQFSPEDVEWNAHVDFAGGEPSLLENLEEYLEFFYTRRIRVLMFTNAARFHQAIYDGLADGSIYLAITSLDAGTPSTFKALRGRDRYLQVLENLSRYAAAGSKGKGMLAVKYIFCESNCSDDDVVGFAYTMLAMRPQQVWLTFDFTPLLLRQEGHDYSEQIEAYAKLYLLLKKHGLEAFHYFKEAIATVSQEGQEIMNRVLCAIAKRSSITSDGIPELNFKDFRKDKPFVDEHAGTDKFSISPLRLRAKDGSSIAWSLDGKRVLLVPSCPLTQKFLSDPDIQRAAWIGFIDRSPTQHGKMVEGRSIYSYDTIPSLDVDAILIASPEKHRSSILESIAFHAPLGVKIAEFEPGSFSSA